MKQIFTIFLGIILALSLSDTVAKPSTTQTSKPLDKIVVVVNDSIITQSQVDQELAIAKKQFAASKMALPNESELRTKIIDSMINREIQLRIAKRANITISDAEINTVIADIAKRNKITPAKLRSEIEKSGMSFNKYRSDMRDHMIMNRLQQHEIGPSISISDADIDNFLQNYRNMPSSSTTYQIQDFLIPLSDNPTNAELQKAKQSASQIITALRNNKDPHWQSSDLGTRTLNDIPSIFVDAVKTMRKGMVSEPITAPNGLHVLKLVSLNQGKSAEINRDQARNMVYQQKINEKLQDWIKILRANSYIKFVEN